MTVRYISSPKLDNTLTPDEFRRYTNQMIGWFFTFFILFAWIFSHVLFNGDYPFWATLKNIASHNEHELSKIMVPLFYTKCAIDFIPSAIISYIFMNKLTKPINKQVHKRGNFLDESPEVFQNIAKEFHLKTPSNTMALIREGEFDYNKSWKGDYKIKQTIYFPKENLELSTVIRGEAGSGKSVVLDRLAKESIDNGNKCIFHDPKGDFIKKLSGYTSFYVIEPWNDKRGYALDFMNMVVSDSQAIQNANIRTLVDSFNVATPGKEDFFNKGATAVNEALVRSVVETFKDKSGTVTADEGAIVDIWNSFQVRDVDTNIDLTDPKQVSKELSKNDDQLQVIKNFLLKWNPSATIYVDPENAKTSLCVLASCIEFIRKFEVLSSFWKKNRENGKVLNIKKWLNTEPNKDRQVIVLVNSNQFEDVANCYISAFVNLVVNEVIEERYDVPWELHFMLDEFPQLTSININKFQKLPDVGRGKGIRTTVAMQRTSQMKSNFNIDGESFVAGFQNKIWCRMASDDLAIIEKELGRKDVADTIVTVNNNNQNSSSSSKTSNAKVDVINAHDLQNELGPVTSTKLGPNGNSRFLGVKVLFKFANIKRVPIILMPPVKFDKREKYTSKKSSGSSSIKNHNKNSSEDTTSIQEVVIETKVLEEIETKINPENEKEIEEKNPLESIIGEQVAHAIGGEALAVAMQVSELIEALGNNGVNNNTTEIVEEVSETKINVGKKIEELKNKNKKKQEMEI
jgi:hypothetical protein